MVDLKELASIAYLNSLGPKFGSSQISQKSLNLAIFGTAWKFTDERYLRDLTFHRDAEYPLGTGPQGGVTEMTFSSLHQEFSVGHPQLQEDGPQD